MKTQIILALALILSLLANLSQCSQRAQERAQAKQQAKQLVDANHASLDARRALEVNRDECEAQLTAQQRDAAEIQRISKDINDALQDEIDRKEDKLRALRATPECQKWADLPSCGVGEWP